MHEESETELENHPHGPQVLEALRRIEEIVMDGLKHGFFRFTIASEIGRGKNRDLVIEAGKSEKFTIPEDELRR